MEGISKQTLAESKLFRFLVGPGKRAFTIHSALVAHQSPVLEAMVYGAFKESHDYFVEWDDIDETAFLGFWQFAYTGDYDAPEPLVTTVSSVSGDETEAGPLEPASDSDPLVEPGPVPRMGGRMVTKRKKKRILRRETALARGSAPEPEPGFVDISSWNLSDVEPPKKETMAKREMLWNDFQNSWSLDPDADAVRETKQTPTVRGDILLHHAKVYVLADRYQITRLMSISFRKLHRALVAFDASPSTVDDVVTLLRFCYAELVPDLLRRLVVHYAACKVETLWKRDGFQQLLEESGAFSRALVGSVLLRLD